MSKTLLITGGTSGIGRSAVLTLMEEGWKIILLARDESKVRELMMNDKAGLVSWVHCDLTDFGSVKKAAHHIRTTVPQIDVLMNNAGGIVPTKQVTVDGFERTFSMNHLGHFFLTTELMELLIKSKTRIINVSSSLHKRGKLVIDDLMWQNRPYQSIQAYSDAKLFAIYFTRELHNRFHKAGITSFSLHPGVVTTNFGNEFKGVTAVLIQLFRLFMITPKEGAKTQVFLAVREGIERQSGLYFEKERAKSPSALALSDENAEHLWEVSEQLVEPFR